MRPLEASFEDVADWCEKHLEVQRGREIGMTFGAMIRAYGRLATVPAGLPDEERTVRMRQENAGAEELLLNLSRRFLVAYGWLGARMKPVDPKPVRTNMSYDPGPRPQQ